MTDGHRCPECDHDCATFGSLLSHLRNDHAVYDAFEPDLPRKVAEEVRR